MQLELCYWSWDGQFIFLHLPLPTFLSTHLKILSFCTNNAILYNVQPSNFFRCFQSYLMCNLFVALILQLRSGSGNQFDMATSGV